jgi:hypothetical protein
MARTIIMAWEEATLIQVEVVIMVLVAVELLLALVVVVARVNKKR